MSRRSHLFLGINQYMVELMAEFRKSEGVFLPFDWLIFFIQAFLGYSQESASYHGRSYSVSHSRSDEAIDGA